MAPDITEHLKERQHNISFV